MRNRLLEEFRTVKYVTKLIHTLASGYFFLMLVAALVEVALPFFNLLLFRDFINALVDRNSKEEIIRYVIILVVGNGLLYFTTKILNRYIDYRNEAINDSLRLYIGRKIMNLKYALLEEPNVIRIKDEALDALRQQDIMRRLLENSKKAFVSFMMILGLSTLILALSPIILLCIIGVGFLNMLLLRKSQELQFKLHQALAPLNRKFGYYMKISNDPSMAKDIRVSDMSVYIIQKVKEYHEEVLQNFGILHEKTGIRKGLIAFALQVQTFVLYAYMTFLVLRNSITVGSFLMYISAGSQFSTHFNNLFQSLIELRQVFKYFEAFRVFDAFEKEQDYKQQKRTENQEFLNIEFRNVCFKYLNSDRYALENISFQINDGEKIAFVGQNGAGKSTVIKLLCGLYQPTSGEILINGKPVSDLNFDEYSHLISSVFQDSKLFSFTLLENLSANSCAPSTKVDLQDLFTIFEMDKKIENLKQGIDSVYSKSWSKEGVLFSGGETQKLTIIRAFMKKAPILIMDEPTSALDAYAESKIYSSLNEMQHAFAARIIIFVSHRLSSCKFCDKIMVFHSGRLVEYGRHDELLKRKGQYTRLWEAQASNYSN